MRGGRNGVVVLRERKDGISDSRILGRGFVRRPGRVETQGEVENARDLHARREGDVEMAL